MCLEGHPDCAENQGGISAGVLPSRLIDVGLVTEEEGSAVYLLETVQGQHYKYLTLSHPYRRMPVYFSGRKSAYYSR